MTAAPAPLQVTEPGVYVMTEGDYHADPVPGGSLSSTGARKLLAPSCPAIFAYEREHPPAPTKAFDLGHGAHEMVLGGGPELVRCPFDSWRTNAAKEMAADARARGAVPLLGDEYQQLQEMAAALRAHPFAGRLFAEGAGTPEASLFTRDEETGVMLRGRLDWLPNGGGRRLIVPDLKTARTAYPTQWVKAAADHGYHCQAAWYSALVRALGIAEDVAFVFVVQEKTPPYVVSVIQLDVVALRIGAAMNRRAIHTYAECTRTGVWPGYVDDVALTPLPAWYERQHEEDFAS